MASNSHVSPNVPQGIGVGPRRLAGRWLASAALVSTAVVHLMLVPDQLSEAPYMGAMFLGFAALTLALAAALAVRDSRLAWLVTLVVSVVALVTYALSRTTGLPLMPDDVGDWMNPIGLLAVLAEAVTVILAGFAVRGTRQR